MGSGYLMRWANSMACAECDVCEVRARNISTRKLLVLRFRRELSARTVRCLSAVRSKANKVNDNVQSQTRENT